MFQAKLVPSYVDEYDDGPINSQDRLAEILRPYLTENEAKSLGYEPANDAEEHQPFAQSLFAGIGAAASTASLFIVVGFFATLGLPEVSLLSAVA